MPNPENIVKHQFKPGESGNPKGRPKLPKIDEEIADVLSQTDSDGNTKVKLILERVAEIALNSKRGAAATAAAKELLDRAYGKSTQKVELAGNVDINWTEEKTYAKPEDTSTT
jgi:Family of unknown function (DUF5681)